jgi:hypothetical protein
VLRKPAQFEQFQPERFELGDHAVPLAKYLDVEIL